jgi:hypothetical protein
VLVDHAGQHLLEVVLARVVAVVAELGDEVGEARVGEHRRDLLETAAHPTASHGGPQRHRASGRVLEAALTGAGELVEGRDVVLGQRGHEGLELGVGHGRHRPVEQRQRLQAVLHLIHGQPGYR